jgi:hypothetical protein
MFGEWWRGLYQVVVWRGSSPWVGMFVVHFGYSAFVGVAVVLPLDPRSTRCGNLNNRRYRRQTHRVRFRSDRDDDNTMFYQF